MTVILQDIKALVKEAQSAYGSANPALLGGLVERLIVAVSALVETVEAKDAELRRLRTMTFGSTSERASRAEEFLAESERPADVADNAGTEPEPAASAASTAETPQADEDRTSGVVSDADELETKAAELSKKMKELKREARALQRQMTSKEEKKLSVGPEVATETVRRPLPDELDVCCPLCEEKVKDAGLSRRAVEIDILPSAYIKREYLLHKGVCACGSLRFVMPGPDRGVEKTNYSPRFIAKLIYDKFSQHLPSHRQAKAMALSGLKIHRNTLISLLLKSYLVLKPLAERIHEINREQRYQSCDESPIRTVIKGEKKNQYLWCLVTDQAISFKITATRNKVDAKNFVGETPGVLTSDRLNIYWDLIAWKDESGCNAHMRRKFWYALPSFPDEAMAVIRMIGEIYAVESEAKAKKLTPDQRLVLRQEKSVAILERIKSTISAMDPPPRSALGEAIRYTLDHWPELIYFTKDGRVSPDNNVCEGALRVPKLGWKNFLFVQSELGAEAVAGFYTILATCVMHGVHPIDYLSDVLIKLGCGWKAKDLDELLPWNWAKTKAAAEGEKKKTRIERLSAATVVKLVKPENRIRDLKAKQAVN